MLDAVEDVLGPDILCWNTSFFTKEAQSSGYVSWHQDATYWGLSEPDVVTAWVAFTQSTLDNGNMRVFPKSHRRLVPHVDTFHPDNLLRAARRSRSRSTSATRSTSSSKPARCPSITS